METVARITGQPESFNALNVQIESFDQEKAEKIGERIHDRLKRMDERMGHGQVVEPDVHWAQEPLDAIFLANGQRVNFAPYDVLAQEIGNLNRTAFIMVESEKHDVAFHTQLVDDLRETYAANQMKTTTMLSIGEVREQIGTQFDVIVYLMLVMAFLAALVGGMGLMSTMSINVVERGREIGVMRSIGATYLSVASIFVGEGVLVEILSWALAVPISYPGARSFSNLIGKNLMELALDFKYPASGLLIWLAIVVVISAPVSFWSAVRATKVSVRESLSYE